MEADEHNDPTLIQAKCCHEAKTGRGKDEDSHCFIIISVKFQPTFSHGVSDRRSFAFPFPSMAGRKF